MLAPPFLAITAGVFLAFADSLLLVLTGWLLFFGGSLVLAVRVYWWISGPEDPKG